MKQHNLDGITIANNIRAERNRANLSQEDVAKLLGVSRETYSSYEKDARVIRYKNATYFRYFYFWRQNF